MVLAALHFFFCVFCMAQMEMTVDMFVFGCNVKSFKVHSVWICWILGGLDSVKFFSLV